MLTVILAIVIAIVLVILLGTRHLSSHPHETYDLPPLNYFTLGMPAYFFYDPDVHEEGEDHRAVNSPPHPAGIEDIFGPGNFFRYNSEDLHLAQE